MRVLLVLVCALLCLEAPSQEPAYKRFPNVPPFRLLLTDSSTVFTKADLPSRTPVLVIVFSPECEHCQHQVDSITSYLPQLEPVQVVMASMLPLDRIRSFYQARNLNQYSSIIMGKDMDYLLPGFFGNHHLPFLAVYNRKGKLVSAYEGNVKMEKLIYDLNK